MAGSGCAVAVVDADVAVGRSALLAVRGRVALDADVWVDVVEDEGRARGSVWNRVVRVRCAEY